MGYTHYWYKEPEIDTATFHAIAEDFNKLILPLHDNRVPLAGSDGEGTPEISGDVVAFNGMKHCGHPQNSAITIPWPTPDAGSIDRSAKAEAGSWFAGTLVEARCCNGECDYESFVFERQRETPEWQTKDKDFDGRAFDCCKTAFRPYDIAVTAFLLIAKRHIENRISVKTDGEDGHWWDAKMLCQSVLGYGADYQIQGDELKPIAGEEPYKPVRKQAAPEPEKPRRTVKAGTVRRDWLRKQVEAEKMECRCDGHYTDDYLLDAAGNFGKTEWKPARIRHPRFEPREMPGGFTRDVCVDPDTRDGFMNMMECDFTGNCGRAYAAADGKTISLHVHSNLSYTLRFK